MIGHAANDPAERAGQLFRAAFGGVPSGLAWGPGRVNLIGEHTDYNQGFVLPMALERATWLAFRPRDDGVVRLVASDLDGTDQADGAPAAAFGTRPGRAEGSFELWSLTSNPTSGHAREAERSWLDYPKAVAWSLLRDGHDLQGFDGVIASDVPRGAGLSSSAALELAVAATFQECSGFDWQPVPVARALQRAENEWVGVASGIMDQLIGAAAVAGHAMLIDCLSLELQPVPLPREVVVVVLDTATRRSLAGSAYNDRRAACERVAGALGLASLRNASPAMLEAAAGRLDPTDRDRARHVVDENERTVAAARRLSEGDVAAFGALMNASHASLQELYQVSSPELDAMVDAARSSPGCLGARMTGAGFGGCAVALVAAAELTEFIAAAAAGYRASTGLEPSLYPSRAGRAAGVREPT